jgi:UPF0755 protein
MDVEQDQKKKKPSALKIIWTIVSVMFFIVIGAGVGGALYIANALQPVSPSEESVRIKVPPGSSSSQIAKLLEEHGLIKDSFIFTYYLKVKKEGSRFQAGEYLMMPGTTYAELITKLNNGDIIKEEVTRLTIPEGFTVVQIAGKIAEQGIWSDKLFVETANRPDGLKSILLGEIPDNPEIRHRLEGYLFPETYEFKKGTTEAEIIERALLELEKKLATLPADWKDKLTERGISFHQMLTIASLIEREVVVEEERQIVAGVIYNRLNKKMPLQIDATVQYALGAQKERLFEKDLKINSPYNTYENPGIPPGPIASPSLGSIEAALYPAETPYFFYVTKKDGSQGHLFAVSYEEHLKNIAASNKK